MIVADNFIGHLSLFGGKAGAESSVELKKIFYIYIFKNLLNLFVD